MRTSGPPALNEFGDFSIQSPDVIFFVICRHQHHDNFLRDPLIHDGTVKKTE